MGYIRYRTEIKSQLPWAHRADAEEMTLGGLHLRMLSAHQRAAL